MSMTLSRRLRRIGVLPTSILVTDERQVVHKTAGTSGEITANVTRPIKHHADLTHDERAAAEAVIREDWKQRHFRFLERRKRIAAAARERRTLLMKDKRKAAQDKA